MALIPPTPTPLPAMKQVDFWVDLPPGWQDNPLELFPQVYVGRPLDTKPAGVRRYRITNFFPCFGGSMLVDQQLVTVAVEELPALPPAVS